MVQEGDAALYRVAHHHAVALRVQQIARHEQAHLEVLRPTHRVPPIAAGTQIGFELAQHRVLVLHLCPEVGRERTRELRGVVPAAAVRVVRVRGIFQVLAEEQAPERLRLRIASDVAVQARQKHRAPGRVGASRPEAPDLVFPKDVVAAEDLVGPLAGEHDLDPALANQPGQAQQRGGRGTHHRPLGEPHHVLERTPDVRPVDLHFAMVRLEVPNHLALELALVETRVGETDREGRQVVDVVALHERGQDRRIESAAEIGCHRHVRAQLQPHGVMQHRAHLVLPRLEGLLLVIVLARELVPPVLVQRTLAFLQHERAPRRELLDALERRSRRHRHPEGRDLSDGRGIDFRTQAPVR